VTVVGHAYDLRLIPPRNGDEHRPKNLLAREPPVVGVISKDCGDCEIAFRQWPILGRQPAEHEAGFFSLQSILHIAADLGELLLVDDAADVARLVEWVADAQRLRLLHQPVEKIVEDIGMQEQSRSGGAGLTLSREAHRVDDAIDDPVFVGVGIYDRRAFAAKLERHGNDALGRGGHDELADLGRSGERQLPHQGMMCQRLPAFFAVTRQHIEHAGRQDLLADLRQ
jgi:hypothetical protein